MPDLDLIVIGGGVNGAGIARDAARRGLRVALFEQGDLGGGTSGASSGMIHGGGRYLLTDRSVTHNSCLDSGYIQAIAPHLLFRIPFVYPLRQGSLRNRVILELAYVFFQVYDRFQPLKRGLPAAKLSREEALRIEPGLNPAILGAVTTDEWGINVFRLCVLNALDAAASGAGIHLRHRVEGFLRGPGGRVTGVRVRDLRGGPSREVHARMVFNAAGPWAGRLAALAGADVKLRPGKGIHLVLDRRICNYAILVDAIDGRQVFLEPYGQETWIGTTDDDYYGDPTDVQATYDEVEYLIEAVSTVFPSIRDHRLVRTFAGVRPTLRRYGPSESDLGRDHRIWDHTVDGAPGLWSIGGGKLAAYRLMAEEATDAVCAALGHSGRSTTHRASLPGGEATPDPLAVAESTGVDPYAAARLVHRHGARVAGVVERIQRDPRERRVVCACEPVTEAEIRFCIETEWVTDLEDLRRRTHCGGGPCQGARCARQAAWILAGYQDGSPARVEALLAEFVLARWREQAPVVAHGARPQLDLVRWALRRREEGA